MFLTSDLHVSDDTEFDTGVWPKLSHSGFLSEAPCCIHEIFKMNSSSSFIDQQDKQEASMLASVSIRTSPLKTVQHAYHIHRKPNVTRESVYPSKTAINIDM